MTQHVACKFRQNDTRTYTYANDGDPVEIGDMVKVPDSRGWKRVEVVSISDEKPSFPTKAISGLAPPETPDDEEQAA